MNRYEGEILTEVFPIRQLAHQGKREVLKHFWEQYKGSETPVLILCPFLEKYEWQKIALTNIYLTVDSKDRAIEEELRRILAPKPNILERIYHWLIAFLKRTSVEYSYFPVLKVQTVNYSF